MPTPLEIAVQRGLVNPDGTPTGKGRVIAMTQDHPDKDRIREFYDRGLIDDGLKQTPKGRMTFADEQTAVQSGPNDYLLWEELHPDKAEPVSKGIIPGLWKLATEDSRALGRTMRRAVKEIPVLGTVNKMAERNPVYKFGFDLLYGKDAKELKNLSPEEREAAVVAQIGEEARSAMKIQAGTLPAIYALLSEIDPSATKEDKALMRWNLKKEMLKLDELSPAQAAATASEFFLKGSAEYTRQKIEEARAKLTPEQLAILDKEGSGAGNFLDPAFLTGKPGARIGKGALGKAAKNAAKPPSLLEGSLHRSTEPIRPPAPRGDIPAGGLFPENARPVMPNRARGLPEGFTPAPFVGGGKGLSALIPPVRKPPAGAIDAPALRAEPSPNLPKIKSKWADFTPPLSPKPLKQSWATKAARKYGGKDVPAAREAVRVGRKILGASLFATGSHAAGAMLWVLHPERALHVWRAGKKTTAIINKGRKAVELERKVIAPFVKGLGAMSPLLAKSELPRGNARDRLNRNVALFKELADAHGVDSSQLALAWLLSKRDQDRTVREQAELIAEELAEMKAP